MQFRRVGRDRHAAKQRVHDVQRLPRHVDAVHLSDDVAGVHKPTSSRGPAGHTPLDDERPEPLVKHEVDANAAVVFAGRRHLGRWLLGHLGLPVQVPLCSGLVRDALRVPGVRLRAAAGGTLVVVSCAAGRAALHHPHHRRERGFQAALVPVTGVLETNH